MTKLKHSKNTNKRPTKRPAARTGTKKYVTLTLNLSEDTETFLRKVARLSDQSLDTVISVILALDIIKKRALKAPARKSVPAKKSKSKNPFANVRVLKPPAAVTKNASVSTAEIDRALRKLSPKTTKRRVKSRAGEAGWKISA